MITEFDLKLANYIQDKGRVDFDSCVSLFGKSPSTLKRSIYTLNEYLSESLHFSISNHEMKTNMTYADFADLCMKLTMEEYSTSVDERLILVICAAFFQGVVNMTQLYKELNLSISTKKNDRKELGERLRQNNIDIVNRHRKGIELVGNERYLRMYVARKLISVIELNENDTFIPRKANTPVQKMLYTMFEKYLSAYHEQVTEGLSRVFGEMGTSVDYASKKFIYIHYGISLMRIRDAHKIETTLKNMPEVPRYHLLPAVKDSRYLDYLIVSLNYKKPLRFPDDDKMHQIVASIIQSIETGMDVRFYTSEEFYEEMYNYLYKCSIKNKLEYFFYDDKLDDTKKEFPNLYAVVKKGANVLSERYGFELTEHQLSVICLMAQTYIMKNHLVRKHNPRIIIITNSSVEKVNFFLESLKQHVDFEMVSYLTINELYKLDHLAFDAVLTFSNRIKVLLDELGWDSIKVNFYLTTEDIKKLLDNGFVSNRNRKKLVNDIAAGLMERRTKEEVIRYLKECFPEHLI